jgi:hypothetical protein
MAAAAVLGAPAATVIATAGPAAAGATVVSTETELRTAFDTDSSIVLANDITLTDCSGGGAVTRSAGAPVEVMGEGFTITPDLRRQPLRARRQRRDVPERDADGRA